MIRIVNLWKKEKGQFFVGNIVSYLGSKNWTVKLCGIGDSLAGQLLEVEGDKGVMREFQTNIKALKK